MRQAIGIDVDGVLASFESGFNRAAATVKPGFPHDYVPSDWNWSDSGLTKEQISKTWEVIKRAPGFWERLQPYSENVKALYGFLNRNPHLDIYYVTSRVVTIGRSPLVQTANWLGDYDLLRDNTSVVVVESAKFKPEIIIATGIRMFIDDYAPTCLDLSKYTESYCLNRPWNSGEIFEDARVFRTDSLKHYLDIAEMRFEPIETEVDRQLALKL